MRLFDWLCATEIPPACDLRPCGWRLGPPGADADDGGAGEAVALAYHPMMTRHAWARLRLGYPRARRGRVLLLGVGRAAERARLLHLGFGDVMGRSLARGEVEAHALRVAALAGMVPSHRTIGALRLDLFVRDGFVGPRRLALHPREFALLWRLAEAPGQAIAKRALLSEVWRLGHVPETNSLAVHVFRLRAKLAAAGLADLVLTAPAGGYLLAAPADSAGPAIPLLTADSHLHGLILTEAGNKVAIGDCRHET